MVRSASPKLRARPRRTVPPAPPEVRLAVHAAVDDLLDKGATVFLIHGESPIAMHSVSVPSSDALAEGIARRVFQAWFRPHVAQK